MHRTNSWLRENAPALFGTIALLAVAGCTSTPDRAPWRTEERTLQPMGDEGRSKGALVVETAVLGTERGEEFRSPFFLYDEQGRYLTHFPNRTMPPVSLSAGRYVVVSNLHSTNRRVQVVVKEGQTTQVRLSDFRSAPEAE